MKSLGFSLGIVLAMGAAGQPAQDKSTTETIVVLRHGEKPPQGLGSLTCKGLNRALKLPAFFAANFARPDYIFAPNPSVRVTEVHGDGNRYDYVRPLLTIGPTAIQLGVPINTQIAYNDPGLLAKTLLEPQYHGATVFVAWEHAMIVEFTKILLGQFGDASKIPEWGNSDYETVFVFTIGWSEPNSLKFDVRSENLGPIGDRCPAQ